MSRRGLHLACVSAVLFFALTPAIHALGLAGRVALEAVAAANTDARSLDDPTVILDLVSTVRVGNGWDIVLRPWSLRRPGGDWTFEMYQAEVRSVSSTKVPFRVDAGIISSSLGLATLELQPHANPLIGSPFYYLTPLPAVDGRSEGVRLMSGGYPLGAMFSISGAHLDARAGVTDTTAARQRWVFNDAKYDASPQLLFGAGISPKAGFRVGADFARGQYRFRLTMPSGATIEPQDATIFNLEAEYAVGHTRASDPGIVAHPDDAGRGAPYGYGVSGDARLSTEHRDHTPRRVSARAHVQRRSLDERGSHVRRLGRALVVTSSARTQFRLHRHLP